MTDFNDRKARVINSWVGNEQNINEDPKATNIWLKFNELVQHLSDQFDTLVRSLFSVQGEGNYNSTTGTITINAPANSVVNVFVNPEEELIIDYLDSSQDNLGVVGGGFVKDAVVTGTGKITVTYQNGYIAEYTANIRHENYIFLPFEGDNGSTTTEQLGDTVITASFLGGATISTDQAANGFTSAKFPDNDGSAGITLVNSAGLNLDSEWEIELTFFPTKNDTSSGQIYSFMGCNSASFQNGFYFGYLENTCLFRILDSSGNVSFGHDFGVNYFALNAWHTIKIRREETEFFGEFRMTIEANGEIVKDLNSTIAQPTTTVDVVLGNNPALLSVAGCNGYIDLFSFKYL